MTDNQTPTYVVHEFRVSDRNLLDAALDAFQPEWRTQPNSAESGSLAFIADSATFTLGLYHDDQPMAISWGYRLRLPTGARSVLVHDIQVQEDHRQQGLGRQLLKAVLQLARDEGQHHVWGIVEADNAAAHALARSAGGLSAGSQRGDIVGDTVYEWRFGTRRSADPYWTDPPTLEVPATE